jgi:hypothetical protein
MIGPREVLLQHLMVRKSSSILTLDTNAGGMEALVWLVGFFHTQHAMPGCANLTLDCLYWLLSGETDEEMVSAVLGCVTGLRK